LIKKKPLKVLQHIIKLASNEGDIVFNPFIGIASTGLASIALNRKFIGIEVEKKYIKGAESRLKQFYAETRQDRPDRTLKGRKKQAGKTAEKGLELPISIITGSKIS